MSRTRFATTALLIAWGGGGTVVGVWLMRSHWVPRPVPPAGDVLPGYSGGWTALHALGADCRCSRRVLARLHGRPPLAGVRERILWVGGEAVPTPVGFEVESLTADGLRATYRTEAVPVLVVADPDGLVRYRGGYTTRKQGLEIRDEQIISAVRRGESVPPLPVYGCESAGSRRVESLFPAWLGGDTP